MIADTLSAFAALLFVLAIIVALSWGIRRMGLLPGQPLVKNGKKQIKIVESRIVDGRNRLVVVEWKEKQYLLATNPNGVTTISETDLDLKELVEKDANA